MDKSPDAFRTISEVADWLGVQAHVLRFWESKFPQVKPVKRAGGRRYYRPADMELIGGIKTLLHDQGMTIKGVQKTLREEGVAHVSSFSPGIDEMPPEGEILGQNVLKFQGHPMEEDIDDGPLFRVAKSGDAVAPNTVEPTQTPTETPPELTQQPEPETAPAAASQNAPRPRPRVVDAPDPPQHSDIEVTEGPLALVAQVNRIDAELKAKIVPLVSRLAALRDRMSASDSKG